MKHFRPHFPASITVVICFAVFTYAFLPHFTYMAFFPRQVSYDHFDCNGALEEVGDPSESESALWWLDSGARFFVVNDVGRTLSGTLSSSSRWRMRYERSNSADTERGTRPQNIFRLFTRVPFQNIREEAYFRMFAYDTSESRNRNSSNGFSLISRYQNANNFYYGGIRVDGSAVIKKKLDGAYRELAYAESFLPEQANGNAAQELISGQKSIGVRFKTTDTGNGQVELKLFVRTPSASPSETNSEKNEWREILSAVDNGTSGRIIKSPGLAGIRTDFMDAEIAHYEAREHNGGLLNFCTYRERPLYLTGVF